MKLNSANLDAFYAASRLLSFSSAAKELGVTQSALSQRILNLENTLETKLFIREPSGIRLTESGLHLLRHCQTQAALEDEVLSRISSTVSSKKFELRGTIRIGGFSSVMRSLILPELSPILLANPMVKLEFCVEELSKLPKMLKNGEIDFMILDHIYEDSSQLAHLKMGVEENVLVESIHLKAGREHIFLDHDATDLTTIRYLKWHGRNKLEEISRIYLDDIYGVLDAVHLGWGRAVVPQHLIANEKTIRVVSGFKSVSNPIILHHYNQLYYSELHKTVLKRFQHTFT